MGRTHAALSLLILGAVLFLGTWYCAAQGTLPPAVGKDIRFPICDEETGRYIGYLYAERGDMLTNTLEKMRFDIFRDNLTTYGSIPNLSKTPLYELGKTPTAEIERFWRSHPHSQGIVFSDSVVYDFALRTMKTDVKVTFLTPSMDMEGEGMMMNVGKKELSLFKNVKTVLRQDMLNSRPAASAPSPSEKRISP